MSCQHGFNVKTALVVLMSAFLPIVVARAEWRPDGRITTEAQTAVQADEGLRMSAVMVDTYRGILTLRGTVRSEKDKSKAAEEARNVAGVVEVRNLLRVVGPGTKESAESSDAALQADVRRTLAADRSLDDSSITVRSVRKGVVRLSGTATSADDVIRALVSATNRPGVRGVFSEIEGQDAFVSPSPARDVGIPLPVAIPVRFVGVEAEDDVIRRGVERALNDLDARDNADIDVSVTNGVVRLSGIVPTWEGNESRVRATRSVTGVRSIINSLRVVELNASRR